ncbi:ParA family protein [Chryseosolibacter indicus]|uniref:ParA family protein n=1 Tax=Chryseosolibacter indicus TaxID=2782351 RepID=A0ABS5VU96_9BACT|nr:ParA family protein [Chryseosolibacter indicus]MBT1704998.1 ParA family protein [Chryseosolibacter indicus]
MPKVISFISRKGGTGKTTNAINLATTLHQLGKKVVLVETDTNYTLNTLRKMEQFKSKEEQEGFNIVGSQDHEVAEELTLMKQKRGTDVVVVDSAGKTTDEGIKKLCLVSDVVIVPTSLTQNDLLVTYQTVTDLAPAREINTKLKILILPNRIHSGTNLYTVRENLKNLDAIILPVIVPQKNLFVNFSTMSAEKEYHPVAQEILKHIA